MQKSEKYLVFLLPSWSHWIQDCCFHLFPQSKPNNSTFQISSMLKIGFIISKEKSTKGRKLIVIIINLLSQIAKNILTPTMQHVIIKLNPFLPIETTINRINTLPPCLDNISTSLLPRPHSHKPKSFIAHRRNNLNPF